MLSLTKVIIISCRLKSTPASGLAQYCIYTGCGVLQYTCSTFHHLGTVFHIKRISVGTQY